MLRHKIESLVLGVSNSVSEGGQPATQLLHLWTAWFYSIWACTLTDSYEVNNNNNNSKASQNSTVLPLLGGKLTEQKETATHVSDVSENIIKKSKKYQS